MKRVYLLLIVLTIVFSLSAQSNNHQEHSVRRERSTNYQERAANMRAEVWAWDNPAFSNYNIPDELKNESAVILARQRQIDATGKKSNLARQFFFRQQYRQTFLY